MKEIQKLSKEYRQNRYRYSPATRVAIQKLIDYCFTSSADIADIWELQQLIRAQDGTNPQNLNS